MRGDAKYVKSAQEQLAVLQLDSRGSRLSAGQKEALKSNAATYEAALLALVEKDKTIEAQAATMRDAIHRLEPLIATGYAKAAEAADALTKSTIEGANASARLPIPHFAHRPGTRRIHCCFTYRA